MDGAQRILIVESDPELWHGMTPILKTNGYTVQSARDGVEALDILTRHDFDLLLLALHLRDVDGISVLERVVHLYPNIDVVLYSASPRTEEVVRAMKQGATDFILIPRTPAELVERIERVLAESQKRAHPASYGQHVALAKRFLREKRQAAAGAHVHRAIAADPSRPEAFNLKGVLCDLAGHHHEALCYYRVALDLDPTYAPAGANMTRSDWMADDGQRQMHLG